MSKRIKYEVNGAITAEHMWLSIVTYRRLGKCVISPWYRWPEEFFEYHKDVDGVTVEFIPINRIVEVNKLIQEL